MKIDLKKFLFENLGIRQTIFKNTLWLSLGEGVSQVLRVLLIIYVARVLGAVEYGKFTFALAFITIFSILCDLGISQIATRELSQDKDQEKDFSAVFTLKLLLSLFAFLIISASSFFITSDDTIRKIIWILAIYTVLNSASGTLWAFFEARQKMEYESISKIFQSFLIAAFGLLVIFNFPSIENLSWSYLFSGAVALIFLLLFFHFKISKLKFHLEKSIWLKFLSKSWPLAVTAFFGSVYTQFDSVFMGYRGQIEQTGLYNAAYRLITVILLSGSIISQSFFPALCAAFTESKEKLQRVWNYFTETIIFLVVPIVAGGITLAARIIDLVYDPRYFSSIPAFQILLLMAGFMLWGYPLTNILIASNHQKNLLKITIIGAAINIILNIILIPRHSFYGAASAALVSAFVVFFMLFKTVSGLAFIKIFGRSFWETLAAAFFAAFLMFLFISLPIIYTRNVFISVLSGAALYFLLFAAGKTAINKILK